jgi:uncharacterized membrane protein (DUF485 family)
MEPGLSGRLCPLAVLTGSHVPGRQEHFIVDSAIIFFITFGCAFGGALFGLLLRTVLPEHHLSNRTREAVMIGIGLIATLTALVLGLLVTSAKNSFDALNTEITESGAKIIALDRVLARYGPEAKPIRDLLRTNLSELVKLVWPEERGGGVPA